MVRIYMTRGSFTDVYEPSYLTDIEGIPDLRCQTAEDAR